MHITVLGGNGRIGSLVAQQARDAGHHVTILVRNPANISYDTTNISVIQGDATNTHGVATAIHDADIVVHAVSVPFSHIKPTSLYSQVTQAIIDAWPSTSATKLIVMSNVGTGAIRASMPWIAKQGYEYFLGDVADDKEKEESLLEKSSLPRVIIKAPMLTNGCLSSYKTRDFNDYRFSIRDHISRKTVAKAIIDIAESNQVREKIVIFQ